MLDAIVHWDQLDMMLLLRQHAIANKSFRRLETIQNAIATESPTVNR